MSHRKLPRRPSAPLTIEQLEAGLRLIDAGEVDQDVFWAENIEAFRRTVLCAIRDTSSALLSPRITARWKLQFEGELGALVQYLELADRHLARRLPSREAPGRVVSPPRIRLH